MKEEKPKLCVCGHRKYQHYVVDENNFWRCTEHHCGCTKFEEASKEPKELEINRSHVRENSVGSDKPKTIDDLIRSLEKDNIIFGDSLNEVENRFKQFLSEKIAEFENKKMHAIIEYNTFEPKRWEIWIKDWQKFKKELLGEGK